jgi:hypothetical protein
MSGQIFKNVVPKEIFVDLLEKICEKSDSSFIIDNNAYKRMKFHNYHTHFLIIILPYYHWSKRFYIEREFTYSSFMTIVRQLCRLHKMTISSQLRYSESTYTIEYKIQDAIIVS